MYCPKCKRTYNDDNIYCVECGTRLVKDRRSKPDETPIKRFSNRVKTSKPQADETITQNQAKPRQMSSTDQKLDVLILQNKELIDQNKKIIELLEKLA